MFRQAAQIFRSRAATPALVASSLLAGGALYANKDTRARFTSFVPAPLKQEFAHVHASLSERLVSNFVVSAKSNVDYDAVRKDIQRVIDDNNCAALLLRLSWHAAGTFDKKTKTGGSERASMRFKPESEHGANAGLGIARDILDPVHAKYPGLSYADLWSLAAVVAIAEMGGPDIPWRPGRADASDSSSCTPDGRLPDAAQGAQHMRDIFYRMGFNDQEITALVGAHTVGECHKDRSGFVGPWTFDPYGFDNAFYQLLLSEKWQVKKGSDPLQYEDAETGTLMMLPSDMSFLWDKAFRKWVEIYAADEDRWRKDFTAAFVKLQELGVNFGK